MRHLGDITKIDGHKVPLVDIITGGSPCQDLSVAGNRAGLAGERSGLFMEQIRVIKEMHDECRRTNKPIRPRFMVWENVAGVFSSNGGEDFRAVLEETARISDSNATIPRLEDGLGWSNAGCIMADGWSLAWSVHSAEHWGVPQRRTRVALVADFGGQSAPEILFEREDLSGNSPQGEAKGQTAPEDIGGCTPAISFQERAGKAGGVKEYSSKRIGPEPFRHSIRKPSLTVGLDTYNQALTGDQTMTLTGAATDSHHIPCVIDGSTVALEGNGSRPSHHGDGYAESGKSYTLNTTEVHAVAYSQDAYDKYSETEVSATLKRSGGNYGGGTETIVRQ